MEGPCKVDSGVSEGPGLIYSEGRQWWSRRWCIWLSLKPAAYCALVEDSAGKPSPLHDRILRVDLCQRDKCEGRLPSAGPMDLRYSRRSSAVLHHRLSSPPFCTKGLDYHCLRIHLLRSEHLLDASRGIGSLASHV